MIARVRRHIRSLETSCKGMMTNQDQRLRSLPYLQKHRQGPLYNHSPLTNQAQLRVRREGFVSVLLPETISWTNDRLLQQHQLHSASHFPVHDAAMRATSAPRRDAATAKTKECRQIHFARELVAHRIRRRGQRTRYPQYPARRPLSGKYNQRSDFRFCRTKT